MAAEETPKLKSIVFCGGGSGGHLYPAIAIVEEISLRDPDCEFHFLTTGRDVEQRILADLTCSHSVHATVTARDVIRHPFASIKNLWSGYQHAREQLIERKPDCVIGCGGFGSVPGVLAARRLGVPILLLEQNVIPGRATSFLSRIACGTCVSFAETKALLPRAACTVWTGNPVRREIANLQPKAGTKSPTLLVLGGSQGAHAINQAVVKLVARERELFHDWRVIHQTGVTDADHVHDAYASIEQDSEVHPYMTDMASAYRDAELIVSRAGATSLAEISCAGIPAILIPYPHAAGNHQEKNAEWYVERHAAEMVLQPKLDQDFASVVGRLMSDEERRTKMGSMAKEISLPNAAQMVVNVLRKRLKS